MIRSTTRWGWAGAALLAVGLCSSPVFPQSISRSQGSTNLAFPLDGMTVPTSCYSFRRLRTAYVGNKALQLVRASDSTTLDIGFTTAGEYDQAAANAFLTATTAKYTTWYDQCPAANNATQATDASRPTYLAACGAVTPCGQTSLNTNQRLNGTTSVTPATGLVSFGQVMRIDTPTGCGIRQNSGANRFVGSAGNIWQVVGGTSGNFGAPAPDGVGHAGVGIIAGAGASVINIDGVEVPLSTATGNTAVAASNIMFGTSTGVCSFWEQIFWDNVNLPANERDYYARSSRAYFFGG